jgi:enoyl-CoA hydratase
MDAVTRIVLSVPEKLNCLSKQLLGELDDALAAIQEDPTARVVVIEGVGRAFSSGYDLTPPKGNEDEADFDPLFDEYTYETGHMRRFLKLMDMPQVSIAKVHGYALAGGCELATMCDLTIAEDTAKIGYPIVRGTGTPPTLMWAWLLGIKKAKELLLTASVLTGTEAAQLGLINQAVPLEELDATVDALIERLLAVPQDLTTLTKKAIQMQYEVMGIRAGLEAGFALHIVGHRAPSVQRFNQIRRAEGLKAALNWRDDSTAGS